MLRRKDHKAIAEIVRHVSASICKFENLFHTPLANELADYFAKDDPRFDRERFLSACGITTPAKAEAERAWLDAEAMADAEALIEAQRMLAEADAAWHGLTGE